MPPVATSRIGSLPQARANVRRGSPPERRPAARAAPQALPPVRIRVMLLVALLVAAAWTIYPRALAAIELHSSATNVADYALCMVGPTGPALLRDNIADFRRMVRRRLIASAANERPFQHCAKAARQFTQSVDAERAHLATAYSFVEYAGPANERAPGGPKPEFKLDDLAVTTHPLAELSRQAWPFVRDGYTRLVRPSIRAREAIHPVELPRPAIGKGLPSFRAHYRAAVPIDSGFLLAVGQGAHFTALETRDGGITFSPARGDDARLRDVAERCPAGDPGRAFTLGLSEDGKNSVVRSLGPDGPPQVVPLAVSELEVFAAACDARALVAALRRDNDREVRLAICAYRGSCQPMPMPSLAGVGVVPRFPLDIARLDGTTILAVPMGGIVRVASTRDDGRTWTPLAVAFDVEAHSGLASGVAVPNRLLVLGKRVLLTGGSMRPNQTYPVLVSDDQGASFRTP